MGNQTQCQPSLLPPGQGPTGAPGSPRTCHLPGGHGWQGAVDHCGRGQRGAHHGVILKGRHQPCPQEPLQFSWEIRDIPDTVLSPACLLMSQHANLLPQKYHHQVKGSSTSPAGHRDRKTRGQGTAHSYPPCHPEGPPGRKDPCAGHRHPPTRCRNSFALAGKLKLMTLSSMGMSRPRAATSVTSSTGHLPWANLAMLILRAVWSSEL